MLIYQQKKWEEEYHKEEVNNHYDSFSFKLAEEENLKELCQGAVTLMVVLF